MTERRKSIALAFLVISLGLSSCGGEENVASEDLASERDALSTGTGALPSHVWAWPPGGGCSLIQGIVGVGSATGMGSVHHICGDDYMKLGNNFTVQARYIHFVNNVHYTCGDSGPVHSNSYGYASNQAHATQTNTSGVCARVKGRIFHGAVLVQFKLPSGAFYSSGWQNTSYATY